ncbi:MAG: DUF4912 domain-containing protein, partial [Chitinivibrionales bacterium]|nr:DUF4912 domain-containing protein [Chitinivibrionales bacterium]MBD3395230.1 DUF4912 domain-containing protein [Chitinivibrionales bacterium]
KKTSPSRASKKKAGTGTASPAAGKPPRASAAPRGRERPSAKPAAGAALAPHAATASPRQHDARPARYSFPQTIPQAYDETYFRAIPRDPEWIYVYWEISNATLEEVARALGQEVMQRSKRILRVLDVTGIDYDGSNAVSSFDIELSPFANNWYIKVPKKAGTYVVECGYLTPDGRFYVVIRSNAVAVPRGEMSPSNREQWSEVKTDALIRASGLKDSPLGASETFLSSASFLARNDDS